MLSYTLFAVSLVSISAIFLLSLIAHFHSSFQFFPPPEGDSWQHKYFLILFRIFLYPLIVLSFVEFQWQTDSAWFVQFAIGLALLLIGLGFAFRITFFMGWKNAFGDQDGLKTNGHFSWSRNPVYVVTWIGLIGWALVANSILIAILLSMWALMYLLAPLFEEPWLEQAYGEEYREYKARVRRFF